LIGSVVKYFRFSWHEIMFEISYSNLMMMLASIPNYNKADEDEEVYEDLSDENDFMKFFNYN
jgi:hypothetical protein